MCGISGVIGAPDRKAVIAMNRAMQHRGPDDEGIFADEHRGVVLGHRRLSILDMSSDGHQPMSAENGRYWIVFNGEIYNFRELRQEFEAGGRVFNSNSDTEVLLAAYVRWGAECLHRLRGMFSFAIFDRGDGAAAAPAVFLARDRLGIKPLYYAIADNTLIFASELKALLASGLVSRELDRQALVDYLSLGAVAQPRTMLAQVRTLMPGHCMTVRLPMTISISRYWDIAEAAHRSFPQAGKLGREEAAAQLRKHLEDATRLHMVADVPVGAFLSGGIDSTAIVGLMSRISDQPIETYSVGFESTARQPDELPWAAVAAQTFNTRHTELVVTAQDIARQYDGIVASIDQPSLDGTNTYIVSKMAGRSVKVALSGLGGDELFAGYPHFSSHAWAGRQDSRLKWMGEAGRKALWSRIPGRFLRDKELLIRSPAQRYLLLRNLCPALHSGGVASAEMLAGTDSSALLLLYENWRNAGLDPVAEMTYVELNGYLVNTLLRDVDAMAMAHSLEVRPVLLDHVLAEFAFALPSRLKLDPAVNKPLLVDALSDVLPPAIVARKKSGFELPLTEWLAGPLRERFLGAFNSALAQKIFAPDFLRSTMQGSASAPPLRLWAYLMLIEWLSAQGLTL